MATETLDAKGLNCPLPILRTKKAIGALKPGDRYLLASDGLTGMLEDADLQDTLRAHQEPQAADMLKSIDGLAALGVAVFRADPLCGQLFVFVSRRRDRVKILYWDRHGFALWYKRLERGRYPQLSAISEHGVSVAELSLWLEGVDLARTRRFVRVEASRVL